MKKGLLYLALIVSVSVFVLGACRGESELEKVVKAINDECPMSAGDIGDMVSAELQGDMVIVTMNMNESVFNIDALQKNPDLIKTSLVEMLKNPTEDIKTMIDELKKSTAGLTYKYVGKQTGKEISVTLSKEEIQALKTSGEEDPQAVLEAQIAVSRAQLPMKIDEVTIMKDILFEDGKVVYLYDVDEDGVSIAFLEENRSVVEENFLKVLRMQAGEMSTKPFLLACRKTNANIVFRYMGSKGSSIEFEVAIADVFLEL